MCDSKYQYECEMRSTVDSRTDKVSAVWIHIPGNPKSYSNFKDGKRFRTVPGERLSKSRAKSMSLHSESTRRDIAKSYRKSRPGLVVTIATVRRTIPLLIVFKALGFETDGEIWETFLVDPQDMDFYEALRATLENVEARAVKTEEDALIYIGKFWFTFSWFLINSLILYLNTYTLYLTKKSNFH